MSRNSAVVLFLSFGIVVQLSHGIEVNVTQDGELCLYANLMLNFSVSYPVDEKQFQTVAFPLPDVPISESTCEETSSTLKLKFGDGHFWSVNFTLNENSYQADVITFSYNLKDLDLFPNSASDEIVTVTQKPLMSEIDLNTCYSCKSQEVVQAGGTTMTLWNVLIQAFLTEGTKSQEVTVCAADNLQTTTPPVANTTTIAPPTTTSPTPTLPPPSTGKYNLTTTNKTVCLLASFALRISFTQDGKTEEMNLDPTVTKASGWCGESSSELELVSDQMTLMLAFANDMKKFHLNTLNVTLKTSSGVFVDGNANLSLWEAAIGSSYMCNREQNFNITNLLSLYTSNLQVQPFGVKKDSFSTAHECSLDDTSILIPIIVGAALAVLILIVVIAYVIGRRKTYVGYQTL